MEPSRADFCHPYQPYDIQLQFMENLYQTIEKGKIGIFESPTGTGKSLSLICGSLTWLRDHKRQEIDGKVAVKHNDDDDPDWMIEAERDQRRETLLQGRRALEERLSKIRKEETERRRRITDRTRPSKKPRAHQKERTEKGASKDEAEFLPLDYDASSHQKGSGETVAPKDGEIYSTSTQALLEKLGGKQAPSQELDSSIETRIILCSRTHSQLTQFVKELRRVKPPSSITSLTEVNLNNPVTVEDEEVVKHISLGSRKTLCINHKVSQLDSVAAINERCLELQKPGVKEEQSCQFLPKGDKKDLIDSFRDHALAEIRDIEDLGDLGRTMGICPYYASRSAIPSSEILTLPYPLLLQKSAREALGVSVKGHIVIIDEAHNLMDAIADTSSCSLSLRDIEMATSRVMVYIQKFKGRLKGQNRVYVAQIIRLLNSISDCMTTMAKNTRESEAVITAAQLLSGKGVDQIQLHSLIRYLQASKLAYKVEDYHASLGAATESNREQRPSRAVLQTFQSFLAVLMNPSAEGRFFFSRDEQDQIHVRYMLLDPREHFREIVEEARAVILAGGTMSPMSDYRDYLFSYLPADRLQTFSFGHVVPTENIFASAVTAGPSGLEFDFTFEKRKSEKMIAELGLLFIHACRVIPDGVVAFFPSYDYLAHVVAVWKRASHSSGSSKAATSRPTIFSTLNAIKPIFYEAKAAANKASQPPNEPKSLSSSRPHPSQSTSTTSSSKPNPPPAPPSLLTAYTATIDSNQPSKKGALLLSILSGSLSEGINFSDALCRTVLCIGLPYPNAHSAIWKAKLAHIERTFLDRAPHPHPHSISTPTPTPTPTQSQSQSHPQTQAGAKQASREFYTNAALRVVNQGIGRAIRHRDDYAAILLVDARWERDQGGIRGKLPGWIRESMQRDRKRRDDGDGGDGEDGKEGKGGWGGVEEGLGRFFRGRG